jgi:hypothetical protein
MLVSCARNDGTKTYEFLKGENDILKNSEIELKKCLSPKPPIQPIFPAKVSRQERIAKIKQYHDALNNYLNTVIQNCQRGERILNGAEIKISGLDSNGVEEDAINLAKSYERSFGDGVQVSIEIEALAKLEQTKLRQNDQSKLFVSLVAGIIEKVSLTTLAFTVIKDVLSDKKQSIDQDQETQSHLTRLQEMVTTLNRDIADVITKRSELVTSYRAKYPKFAWNELLPIAIQTNTNEIK